MRELFTAARLLFASSVTACDSPCASLTSRETLERRDRYQPMEHEPCCAVGAANILARGAASSYPDGMTTVPGQGRKKARRPFRVEVTRRHKGAKPFGWQVYRRGEPDPIARSEGGYADEAAAWNDGGAVRCSTFRWRLKNDTSLVGWWGMLWPVRMHSMLSPVGLPQ